jgi:hypothetical protein
VLGYPGSDLFLGSLTHALDFIDSTGNVLIVLERHADCTTPIKKMPWRPTSITRQIACTFAFVLLLEQGHLKAGEFWNNRPSTEEIVNRMLDMNQTRAAALQQYTSQRRYVAENHHFSKRAEVTVLESYANPGGKDLKIISATGSPVVQHRVIDKLIEAEIEAGRGENRDQTLVTPQNYQFRLIGTENVNDHTCYVLEVIPRTPKKYLMRGRIWVDDADFAIVRMEGSPAKNPSLWTRRVHFVRRYEKHGPFWLPSSMESESEIFVAGTSTLKIEYLEYQVGAVPTALANESGPLARQE